MVKEISNNHTKVLQSLFTDWMLKNVVGETSALEDFPDRLLLLQKTLLSEVLYGCTSLPKSQKA